MDYKDQWQEYYDDAIENGFSEDAAGRYADSSLSDSYAAQIDHARDKAKEKRHERNI